MQNSSGYQPGGNTRMTVFHDQDLNNGNGSDIYMKELRRRYANTNTDDSPDSAPQRGNLAPPRAPQTRLTSNHLTPETFNQMTAPLRQSLVDKMKQHKSQRRDLDEASLRQRRQEELADHEDALQRHKACLRLQLTRGQYMEGVQRLTARYDASALENADEEEMLTNNIKNLF